MTKQITDKKNKNILVHSVMKTIKFAIESLSPSSGCLHQEQQDSILDFAQLFHKYTFVYQFILFFSKGHSGPYEIWHRLAC